MSLNVEIPQVENTITIKRNLPSLRLGGHPNEAEALSFRLEEWLLIDVDKHPSMQCTSIKILDFHQQTAKVHHILSSVEERTHAIQFMLKAVMGVSEHALNISQCGQHT